MAQQIRPQLVDEPGVWFGIATGCLVATFVLAGAFHVGHTDTAFAAIGVGGLVAARLRALLAPVIGLIGWAFYTGFTENGLGQLTLAGSDLARLGAFAAATAVLAYGVRGLAAGAESRDG
jgi:hypothetical protein